MNRALGWPFRKCFGGRFDDVTLHMHVVSTVNRGGCFPVYDI